MKKEKSHGSVQISVELLRGALRLNPCADGVAWLREIGQPIISTDPEENTALAFKLANDFRAYAFVCWLARWGGPYVDDMLLIPQPNINVRTHPPSDPMWYQQALAAIADRILTRMKK